MGSKGKLWVPLAIAIAISANAPPVYALDGTTPVGERGTIDHRDLNVHHNERPRRQNRTALAVRAFAKHRTLISGANLDPDVLRLIEAIPNGVKNEVFYERHDDPSFPGHWGSYDQALRTVFVGDKTQGRLDVIQYVVDHETAHAFYWQVLTDAERAMVDSTLGVPAGIQPKEGFADCVAKLWGSPPLYAYWDCPPEAVAFVRAVVDR